MRVPTLVFRSSLLVAACLIGSASYADEIRLKDGKKLYGVIVAYEDNMFKVKTDFGFVLVEKDKIASIIPTAPAATAAKQPATVAPKADTVPTAAPPPASAPAKTVETQPSATDVSAKKTISAAPVRPTLPPPTASAKTSAPNVKSVAPSAGSTVATNTPPPAAPPSDEPPPNREEITGNQYTNFTNTFRMYKAPSWELIEDARKALPNAIVAMGTPNESTLMVVGKEKTKEALEPTAATVEKRLHEVYENYRKLSQRKITVGTMPAIEYKYRGMADDHDWSGTLVVIQRGKDILTVLGMTYADTDLIQIQENVIARSISSLNFNVQ